MGAYGDFYRMAMSRNITSSTFLSPLDLFKPGMPAYRLLQVQTGVCLYRIATLTYVNIMLWNHESFTPSLLGQLYFHYCDNVWRNNMDLGGGIEILLWTLGADLKRKEWTHPDWLNLLTRMLSVECRLQESTRATLLETFFAFITTSCSKDRTTWWRPEYVRFVVYKELGFGWEVDDP